MSTARIKFIVTAGVGLWAVTFALMWISVSRTDLQAIRTFGEAIVIAGLLPATFIFDLMHHGKPKEEIVYISIYYLMVGFISGYIGHRLGNNFAERTLIYATSVCGIFVIFFIAIFLVFALSGGES